MDQPFYVISGHVWIIVVLMLMAGLGAVTLCRSTYIARRTSVRWVRGLWLVGGAALSALLLLGSQLVPLAMAPGPALASVSWSYLATALALCLTGTLFLQWLLMREKVSNLWLGAGGVGLSGMLIGCSVLLSTSLGTRLILPHERHTALLLALVAVLGVLALGTALWLPLQPKCTSLKMQRVQCWLSPVSLGLALFSEILMGICVAPFLPEIRPAAHGLIYPALGDAVLSRLLFLEMLIFNVILMLLTFYVVWGRRQYEVQTRSILASNAIGMMLCDFDGRILCMNDAFLEIVGYDRAEVTGLNLSWTSLTPAEFAELDRKAAADLKGGNIVVDYEKRLLRKDGQLVDVLIAGLSQVPDYENTAMGYVLDITEKKKALQGVHESEARFRQLADSNLIGVVFWNIYGSIYEANEVFLTMLGYTRGELQAGEINWRNVTLPQDEVTQAAMVQQAISGEKVEPYETIFLRRDGSRVDVQVGFAMLHGAREKGFSFVQDISERKRAEAALLENYQRINLILEAIPHKVWTAEPNGQRSYSNQNLLKYAGISQESLNEAGWGIYLHPEDLETTLANWKTALATGVRFEVVCRFRRYDGQYRWHLSTAHPVYNADGQLILWVGTNTDIHEMQMAQERLKESEERFRLITEQSPLMIFVNDPQGNIKYANQQLYNHMGFSRDRHLAEQWWERINPEDAPAMKQVVEEAVNQGHGFSVTVRLRNAEGSERWIVVTSNAIFLPGGEAWGYVGTLIDVTDQKHLQDKLEAEVLSRTTELQENMTLLHSLIENVPAAIFLKDARELRFQLFNKVGRELFGFVGDEYMNKTDFDFFRPEQADAYIAKDREALLSGHLVDIPEEAVFTKHGEERLLHTKKVPILDKEGQPAYLLVVAEDITEFKKNQDQILDLNLQLQEQVQAISAANKALESFSYSVSHDLRAPLRTIDGYSQVVLEHYGEHLDDTGKHYLNRVREGSQQMAKLIDDMLNLSRLSRSELKKEKVNLSEIVRGIANDLQMRESEREVEFIIQEELLVDADKRLIQSVLQNLLGNAWKFTSHHPRGIIEFGQLHDVGQPVYYVRDDGAGFDMAYADKLFGTFQRLHSASEFPGTGIGLASAQRIITRHGGEIWAQGEVEHGATFYFTL
jgi:PAS domain S-box-containing protein